MSDTLRDLIGDTRVHVLDGAMGTMLYDRGVFVNVCYDELNLKEPDLVGEVHAVYCNAGAEIIETNTFGANPVKLSGFGLDDRTEEINRTAARVARTATGSNVAILGAIGPLGIRIEPFGPTARAEAIEYFQRQVQGLLEGEVDGFILETFSDLEEIHCAYQAVRNVSDLPVIAQMTVNEDGKTSYGTDVETIARTVAEYADVIGLNCSVGPAAMLDALERMAAVTDRPLSAQPNAGLPRDVGDRKIYFADPEYVARYARRMIEAGARFVGGCCGTTPDHIKKISAVVASVQPRQTTAYVPRAQVTPRAGVEAVPLAGRSAWGRKLSTGEFVSSVEIVPPRGWWAHEMVERCRELKVAGIDAVNVLDGPRSQSRMGVLPSAIIIEREVGIETVVHYTCRDRSMLGMISDLLGAAAAGIRNLLVITGDPPSQGPYNSTGVFDIDSIGLTNVVYRLNHGLDPGGSPIGGATRYVIGVAVNQGAMDLERERSRFAWKVDAGAEFAVTQPVFSPTQLESFLDGLECERIPIIASVWPLTSVRNAEFLANEVPGVTIPDATIDRMREAQSRGSAAAMDEGVQIAREVIQAVKNTVQGVQVSAPQGRIELALAVLDR